MLLLHYLANTLHFERCKKLLSVVPDSNWFLKLGRIGHNLYTNHAFSGNSLPDGACSIAAALLCSRLARFFAFVNHHFDGRYPPRDVGMPSSCLKGSSPAHSCYTPAPQNRHLQAQARLRNRVPFEAQKLQTCCLQRKCSCLSCPGNRKIPSF